MKRGIGLTDECKYRLIASLVWQIVTITTFSDKNAGSFSELFKCPTFNQLGS